MFKVKTLLCALSLLLVTSCEQNANDTRSIAKSANDMQSIGQNTNEMKSIKDFAKDFSTAWNQHNSKAVADLWTIDGDFLSPWTHANLIKGREAIEKYLSNEYQDTMKNSTLKMTIDNIRLIDPETAFADVDFTITGMTMSGIPAEPFNDHAIFILVQRDGKWKIQVARPY